MTKKHIEEGWEGYLEMVVPENASSAQIHGQKQAFYAGAAILFESMLMLVDINNLDTEEENMQRMDNIAKEITDFVDEVSARAHDRS